MANSAPSTNAVVVVTHVLPQQGAQSFTSPQNGIVLTPPSSLGTFLKGEPTVMGTVQIMIGVVVFLFGIVTAFFVTTISNYFRIMFWGSIIYITAGSLTVGASKKLNPCLVKASLGMNIFSTITAGLAIIVHSIDFVIPVYPRVGSCDDDHAYSCLMGKIYVSRVLGIRGVMLVLSVLEFIVSICVSAFACKATCCTSTEQVMYISNQVPPSVSTSHLSAPPLNTSEAPLFQSSVVPPAHHSCVDGLKVGRPEDLPPEYTATQE